MEQGRDLKFEQTGEPVVVAKIDVKESWDLRIDLKTVMKEVKPGALIFGGVNVLGSVPIDCYHIEGGAIGIKKCNHKPGETNHPLQ